jgi:hypothetical protein
MEKFVLARIVFDGIRWRRPVHRAAHPRQPIGRGGLRMTRGTLFGVNVIIRWSRL